MHAKRTLIVLAADEDLRLVSHSGVGRGISEIRHLHAADFPDVDVEFTSPVGRSWGGGGTGKFGHETASKSEDVQERARFAAHVIAAIETEWRAGDYDQMILSAGPKMLGVLRDLMPKPLALRVAADLPKNLIKISLQDLPDHLADVIAL